MSSTNPGDWPPEVRRIGVEDLERLGIDASNRLYWDGKRVEVQVGLTRLQKLLAFVIGLCAVLGGLGGFVTGLKDASEFLCARGHHWLSCADPAAASDGARSTPPAPQNR